MAKDEAIPVSGGCLCGAVRFEGQAFTRSAYYCHCTICQKSAGAPFEIGDLSNPGLCDSLKASRPIISPPVSENGDIAPYVVLAFCGRPMDVKDEWTTNVAVCSLDKPGDVRPCCHTYTDTMLPWLNIADGLPRFTETEMPAVIEGWKSEVA